MYGFFNLTLPLLGQAAYPVLSFCMAPSQRWEQTKSYTNQAWGEWLEEDATNMRNAQGANIGSGACILEGCDPLTVGDGTCNMECYSPACKYDGGDCGGSAFDATTFTKDAVTAGVYVQADKSIPSTCLISPSDAWALGTPFTAAKKLRTNMWEPCGGFGKCDAAGLCPNNCGGCSVVPLPSPAPGVPPPNYAGGGLKCQFCDIRPACTPQTCPSVSRQLTGIQALTSEWDPPLLPSGISVFDPDRMSGVNFTTPAATFRTDGLDQNNVFRPLVQLTCAGELGAQALNGNLQAGIHAPWVQENVAWFADWAANLATCRMQTVVANAPTDVQAKPLLNHQIETRFMVHHPAFWAYQRFYLGNGDQYVDSMGPGGDACISLSESPSPPGDQRFRACYMNTLWDRTRDVNNLVFGKYDFYDPLATFGNLREPTPPGLLTLPYTAWPKGPLPADGYTGAHATYLLNDYFSRSFRMFAPGDSVTSADPRDFSSPCNWDSLAGYNGNPNANGGRDRSCRLTNTALSTLFAPDPADGTLANLKFHFAWALESGGNPICAGAATGATNPQWGPHPSAMPGASPYPMATLNPQRPGPSPGQGAASANGLPAASMALGPGALWHEGFFSWFLSNPKTCSAIGAAGDAECRAHYGTNAPAGTVLYCQDLDYSLMNLNGLFPPRNIDPFGAFVYGSYNVDRSPVGAAGKVFDGCSSPAALGMSIRQFLIGLAGKPREVIPTVPLSASAADPRNLGAPNRLFFCVPNLDVITNVQQDQANGQIKETWRDNNYQQGTCDMNLKDNDAKRVCIMATPIVMNTPTSIPSPVRGYPAYVLGSMGRTNVLHNPSPNSNPAGATRRPYAPLLQQNGQLANRRLEVSDPIPNPAYSGIMGFVPNAYGGPMAGMTRQGGLVASLPAWRSSDVDNHVRERFRWALSAAFKQFNLPMEPNRIYIDNIQDIGSSFPPLLDRSSAGIAVTFTADIDTSFVGNFTLQFYGAPNTNTLGGQAGPTLAKLGLVPVRYQSYVALRLLPPPLAKPADVTGAVVGALIGVGLIGAAGWYFVYGTIFGLAVPNLFGIRSAAAKKAIPTRKVGEVVATSVETGPPRKGSHVETANPMSGAGAAPVAVAVNAMRTMGPMATAAAAPAAAAAAVVPVAGAGAGAAAATGYVPPTIAPVAATYVAVANPLAAATAAAAAAAPAATAHAGTAHAATAHAATVHAAAAHVAPAPAAAAAEPVSPEPAAVEAVSFAPTGVALAGEGEAAAAVEVAAAYAAPDEPAAAAATEEPAANDAAEQERAAAAAAAEHAHAEAAAAHAHAHAAAAAESEAAAEAEAEAGVEAPSAATDAAAAWGAMAAAAAEAPAAADEAAAEGGGEAPAAAEAAAAAAADGSSPAGSPSSPSASPSAEA